MASEDLDDVDRGILHLLQRDARNNTATDIAACVGVTANTVRNRIERLEERGVLTGYSPHVDYEQAGYQLAVNIRCSAPISERSRLAQAALEIEGVVDVRELMTGRGNVVVTVVAAESDDVTTAANQLDELGLDVEDEELIKDEHAKPFDRFVTDAVDDC